MIYSLLNYINKLQQAFEMYLNKWFSDVVKEDYQILEEAVQKSEA